jgi:hypothetical protein
LEVLADSAYGSGEVRAALEESSHRAVIKPFPLRAAVAGGYTLDDFTIDTETNTVTCPAGVRVTITPARNAVFGERCHNCPLRQRCTLSKQGRTIHINVHHDLLAAARRQATTATFQATYRRHRPMVERSIAWLVAHSHRRVRDRGVERNQLGLSHRVAAINLRRLVNLGLGHDGSNWAIAP